MQTPTRSFILAISLLIFSATSYAQDGWQTYMHPKDKYTISYPADWKVREKADYVGFLSPPEDSTDVLSENVNIVVQDFREKPKMTLEVLQEQNRAEIKKIVGPNGKLTETKLTLFGQHAFRFDEEYINNGYHMQMSQYYVMYHGIAYIFTFTALDTTFKKYEPTANKVINSFQFPK